VVTHLHTLTINNTGNFLDGSVNTKLLGTIPGRHQQIEFAPPKRFTDQVMSNMPGIS